MIEKELLDRLYTTEQKTYAEIAQELSVSIGSLPGWLRKFCIPKRPPPPNRMGPKSKITEEKKERAWRLKTEGKTIYQICSSMKISRTSCIVLLRQMRQKHATDKPQQEPIAPPPDESDTEKTNPFSAWEFTHQIKPCNAKKIQKAITDARIDMATCRKRYKNIILGGDDETKLRHAKSA